MRTDFTLSVNGREAQVSCEPQTPLLYVLRNDLDLRGTRFGCGLGRCGACTVLLDGRPVQSCDTPVAAVEGRAVTTIEGLGDGGQPGPLQREFLNHQAAQCGFCLSGILVTATALLRRSPEADEAEIRRALDGNLCRCGSHNRILRAVLAARSSFTEGAAP